MGKGVAVCSRPRALLPCGRHCINSPIFIRKGCIYQPAERGVRLLGGLTAQGLPKGEQRFFYTGVDARRAVNLKEKTMADERIERAQDEWLMKELSEASYALYKLRPTASIAVPVGAKVARVDVYRVNPRSPEVLQDALRKLEGIKRNFAVELTLPVEGWQAPLNDWWHRRRLKLLAQRVDELLQLVTGEQSVLITYRDMPTRAAQATKVKLAAAALIVAGEG